MTQFDSREEPLLASTANVLPSPAARVLGRPPGRKNNEPDIAGWHSERESARLLGESLPTRRRKRRQGIGPRWARSGRHVIHPDGAEEEFLAQQLAATERNAEPRPRGRQRRR